eukprot:Hpha_TRINITY_DN5741_c0_g1::TRINITY_DN5741_c0_g1_i1::g.147666::m.147666
MALGLGRYTGPRAPSVPPSPPTMGNISPRRASALSVLQQPLRHALSPPPPSAALLALSQGSLLGADAGLKVGRAVGSTADILERCGAGAGAESAAVVRELGEVLGELRQRCIATEQRQGAEAAAREELAARVRSTEAQMQTIARGLVEVSQQPPPEDRISIERGNDAVRRAERSAAEAQEAERRLQKLLLQTSEERRELSERLDVITRHVQAGARTPTAARDPSAEVRIAAVEQAARGLLGRVGDATAAVHGVEELRSRLERLEREAAPSEQRLSSLEAEVQRQKGVTEHEQRAETRLSAVEERVSGVMLSQVDQQTALSARTAALEQRQRSSEERVAAAEQRVITRAEELTEAAERRIQNGLDVLRGDLKQMQARLPERAPLSPPPSPPRAWQAQFMDISGRVDSLGRRLEVVCSERLFALERAVEETRQQTTQCLSEAVGRVEASGRNLAARLLEQEGEVERIAGRSAAKADAAHEAAKAAEQSAREAVSRAATLNAAQKLVHEPGALLEAQVEKLVAGHRELARGISAFEDTEARIERLSTAHREVAREVSVLKNRIDAGEAEGAERVREFSGGSAAARAELARVSSDVTRLMQLEPKVCQLEHAVGDALALADGARLQAAAAADASRAQEKADATASTANRELSLGLQAAQQAAVSATRAQEEAEVRLGLVASEIGGLVGEMREHKQLSDSAMDTIRQYTSRLADALAATEARVAQHGEQLSRLRSRRQGTEVSTSADVPMGPPPVSPAQLAAQLRSRTRAFAQFDSD